MYTYFTHGRKRPESRVSLLRDRQLCPLPSGSGGLQEPMPLSVTQDNGYLSAGKLKQGAEGHCPPHEREPVARLHRCTPQHTQTHTRGHLPYSQGAETYLLGRLGAEARVHAAPRRMASLLSGAGAQAAGRHCGLRIASWCFLHSGLDHLSRGQSEAKSL